MSDHTILDAPFPWFGGKRRVACEVWARFGKVCNYVEPFFGSGAVLLGRTNPGGIETVNDKDGFVANFWRALKHDPVQVADAADAPINENDLHARHIWLVQQRDTLVSRLEGDPEYYDAKIAGYWVWGVSVWIGGAFCSGNGPWGVNGTGQLVNLGNSGQGINRKLVHLGAGRGVNRKRVQLYAYFEALAERLRSVRVCSGDWTRVCGDSVTRQHGLTAVFLDPPYPDTAQRDMSVYAVDCGKVAHSVQAWAIAHGDDPLMRIAFCGYEGSLSMPDSWSCYAWNAGQGYGAQAAVRSMNGTRERIWFSPHCLGVTQQTLW